MTAESPIHTDAIRVLHVDDEPDFASLAAEFIRREDDGMEVETETDPAAALDRLEDGGFDCVISDFDMPGRTGIDLLEAVREREPNLPFILFTGKGSEEVASEAVSKGVTDYLQKQAGSDQYALLVNRIRNAVERYQAHEAVAETEQWAQTLLEHSSDYLFVVDGSGAITYISPSVERVMGYDPETLVGESAFSFVHPDDVEDATETFLATMEEADRERTVEFRALDANGDTRWLEVRGRNLLDDPVVGGVLVDARDVTERHALEAELEATLDRYQTLVEQNVAGIYIIQDGGFSYVNPRTCEILGHPEAELLELEDATGLVAEADRERVRENIRRRIEGESPEVAYRVTIVRPDGERREVDVNGRRIEYDGEPAVMGTFVDVTEHQERERELERATRRYRALLENANDAVVRVEFDGGTPVVMEYNDAFASLFVPDGADAVGRDIDELVAREDRREEAREISRRVRDGESIRGRLTRDTVAGPREFLWQAVPIERGAGEPVESGFAIYTPATAEDPIE